MSAPGSGDQVPAVDEVKVLRCGRSVPALHLVEADDTLTRDCWRVGSQDHVALCNARVDESTPVPDYELCPGCRDCVRYCLACVRVAVRYSAELPDPVPAAPGGGPDSAP